LNTDRRGTRTSIGLPGSGPRYEAERQAYGAQIRWRKLLWAPVVGAAMLAIAGFVLQASAQTPPTSPAPLIGSQWSPTRETMRDLIKAVMLSRPSRANDQRRGRRKFLLPGARYRSRQVRRSLRRRAGRDDCISVRKARCASTVKVLRELAAKCRTPTIKQQLEDIANQFERLADQVAKGHLR
jgi:hypothetical protein